MATNRPFAQLQARLATLRLAARTPRLAERIRLRRMCRRLYCLARLGLVPALAAALAGAPLGAQPATLLPVGPVGSVTLDAVGLNLSPDVAVAPDGAIVTVWSDLLSVLTGDTLAATPSDHGILFQRALADGTPDGPIEFVASGRGDTPSVAVDGDGAFVVAWESDSDIFYRRFSQDGTPQGEALPAITMSTGEQIAPDVAMDADGDFVLTWRGPSFESPVELLARRFGRDGAPTSGEIIVARVTELSEFSPSIRSSAVAMSDGALGQAGAFVVAWCQEEENNTGVFARLYRPGATTPSRDIALASVEACLAHSLDVAMDADGDFVVVWLDPGSTITAQRFNAAGLAQGEPIIVESPATADVDLQSPAVAMDADGDFVVSWYDRISGRISSQRYSRDGVREERNFTLSVETIDLDGLAVAMDADGEFVVAWQGSGSGGTSVRTASYLRLAVLVEQRDGRITVSEDGATDSFAIRLRVEPTAPVTVTLTPDRPQIDLGSGPGVPHQLEYVPDGESLFVGTVEVAAVDDGAAEGLHTALVRISADGQGSGYERRPLLVYVDDVVTDTLTVQIDDNDRAFYSVATSTASTNEGLETPVTFTISRAGDREGENRIGYRFAGTATFGKDYAITGGTAQVSGDEGQIVFRPGEEQKTIIISMIDDPVGEPNKSIELWLAGPEPLGSGTIRFPVAVVALGDNDLAEVRVRQSGGGTRVVRGGSGDELTVALRTVPTAPVTITLTPASTQLNLGRGWGAPHSLTFQPNSSALEPQTVQVYTAGSLEWQEGVGPSELLAIRLAAGGDDPSYAAGARFTVDGVDSAAIPVELVVPPGSGPGILDVHLPLAHR